MKMLSHPNIVNLIEVIDDPDTDQFYMGMHLLLSSTNFLFLFMLLPIYMNLIVYYLFLSKCSSYISFVFFATQFWSM